MVLIVEFQIIDTSIIGVRILTSLIVDVRIIGLRIIGGSDN